MSESKQNTRADRIVSIYLAPLLLVGGLVLILYFTLQNFDFQFGTLSAAAFFERYNLYPASPVDIPSNILLFIPFGFGLSAILVAWGWPDDRVRLVVILSGFLLSFAVEFLQIFLPERQPSIADLFSNTLGALLGLGCYRLWQNRRAMISWLSEAVVTPPKMLAGVVLYLLALLMIAGGLVKEVQFSEWDLQYHMLLGNEQTGKREWQGTAHDLIIFNHALKPDVARQVMENPEVALSLGNDLLAYYPLNGAGNQSDLTGRQPDLVWRKAKKAEESGTPSQFDGFHWLETESPVEGLLAQLQTTSSFSVRLSAGTDNLEQTGPARIVTISENLSARNLTLGQANDALVVRFRSPFTAANGVSPEILFPGFFTSAEVNDFVVIFDGLALSLVDSISQDIASVELVPGAVFYEDLDPYLPWYWRLNVGSFEDWKYRLLFYTLMLLPLGIIVALPVIAAWPRRHFLLFLVLCLLAVPLLFELGFVIGSGGEPRPINIFTAVLVLFVSASVTAVAIHLLGGLRRKLQPSQDD